MPEPAPIQSITTAPVTAAAERAVRTRNYLISMAIRTICFISAVIADGWLRWVCVAAAVVLPYVAVVVANAVRPRGVPASATPAGVHHSRHLGRA
ncbi:DUF3099 domain-containing protein [Janibacter sp. GXQ6167]|uniref:DUF3099 domain-containing protein n=1 Tax=Janibacter sp. GXQ6167 TaxID=3240791 RepID=UPI0035248862